MNKVVGTGLAAIYFFNEGCEYEEAYHYYNDDDYQRDEAAKIFKTLYAIVGIADFLFSTGFFVSSTYAFITKKPMPMLSESFLGKTALILVGVRISIIVTGHSFHTPGNKKLTYTLISNYIAAIRNTTLSLVEFNPSRLPLPLFLSITYVGELASRILFKIENSS